MAASGDGSRVPGSAVETSVASSRVVKWRVETRLLERD